MISLFHKSKILIIIFDRKVITLTQLTQTPSIQSHTQCNAVQRTRTHAQRNALGRMCNTTQRTRMYVQRYATHSHACATQRNAFARIDRIQTRKSAKAVAIMVHSSGACEPVTKVVFAKQLPPGGTWCPSLYETHTFLIVKKKIFKKEKGKRSKKTEFFFCNDYRSKNVNNKKGKEKNVAKTRNLFLQLLSRMAYEDFIIKEIEACKQKINKNKEMRVIGGGGGVNGYSTHKRFNARAHQFSCCTKQHCTITICCNFFLLYKN